jgi:hypothetical protein
MEKTEALDFIGLKEPLTEETVQKKYTERFNYYHMLYANAPNKVIEKIQQQNLEKLKQVKMILLEEIVSRKKDFQERFFDASFLPEAISAKQKEKEVLAWLVVHTEDKQTQTFDVFEGVNYIGRKKREEGAGSVILEDDPFVSRTHAFIKVKRLSNDTQFVLYDGDGSKPSVNGVFLNGNEKRINQHCSLTENDTIQIGMTKLVLKIKKQDRSKTGEVEEVLRTDFIRTIDVKK